MFSTGSANLNTLLRGGYPGGELSVITGGVASGRTSLAHAAVRAAVGRGKQALLLDYEERPRTLEDARQAVLWGLRSSGVDLIVVDSLDSTIDGVNPSCLLEIASALRREAGLDKAVVVTWQTSRTGGYPMWVVRSASVHLHLVRQPPYAGGVLVQVQKDRNSVSTDEVPSCLLQFEERALSDVRIVNPGLDPSRVLTRFDRSEVL